MKGLPAVPIWALVKCIASAKFRSAMRSLAGHRRPLFEVGVETPIQTFYDGPLFDPLAMRAGLNPIPGIPPCGLPAGAQDLAWLADLDELRLVVDPARSFFGDCINVVNVPAERALDANLPPFGWSGSSLTGGLAIACSALRGKVRVGLSNRREGFVDISITHDEGLRGVDGALSTPSGYGIEVRNNIVRDAEPTSHARLELATGRLYNFHYNVLFANSAIDLLCELNPGLVAPPLLFPGLPHAGHAMGWLTTEDGGQRLALHIIAQQFLPLGPTIDGRPLHMPPTQTDCGERKAFQAANSSLHPYIALVADVEVPPDVQTRVLATPVRERETYRHSPALSAIATRGSVADYQNQIVALKCIPGATDFGDNFALRSDDLGGPALARSPLFGELRMQFGTVVEGKLPFVIKLVEPTAALRSKSTQLLSLLPPGTEPGLVGMHGKLRFPRKTYLQHELSLTTDPYKVSVGVVDIETGRFEDMILREYLFQNVMRNLLLVEPRTPTDSFCYVCDGVMKSTSNGLLFQLYGDFTIPYPTGYAFPLPNGGKTRIQAGSHLLPFVNIEAVAADAFRPTTAPLEFHSTRHLRGMLDSSTSLTVSQSNQGVVELRGGFGHVEGNLERMAVAKIDGLEITELDMTIRANRRRPAENVYGVVIARSDRAELLLVSEHERFDSWLEGNLVREPGNGGWRKSGGSI